MARFGQGLIQALTNPSYAGQLSQAGMMVGSMPGRLREEEEKRRQFQDTVSAQQQFMRGQQSGDARLASESANTLMGIATRSQNSDLASTALKQQGEVQGIRQQGALKALANIDRALANPTIAEPTLGHNAKDALTQRREELLRDPDVARAYEAAQVAQKAAETDRLTKEAKLSLEQAKVEGNTEATQIKKATSAMLAGATDEQLAQAFPPNTLREARLDVAKYQQAMIEVNNLLADNTPLTGNEPAFSGLDAAARAAVLKTQAAGGGNAPKRARDLLAKYLEKAANTELESAQARREQLANIDKETIKIQYLNDRDSEYRMDENVSEWYRSQDKELRDELAEQFDELFDMGIYRAQQMKNTDPSINVKKEAIDFVNDQMVARYNIDLRPQEARDARRDALVAIYDKARAENPTWSEKRIKDHVDSLVYKAKIKAGLENADLSRVN